MVTLTDRAAAKVQDLIAEQQENYTEPLALRVYVSGGGCSGFSYGLALVEEQRDDDQELESQGVRVLVDSASAQFLDGAEVDYREGLTGGGFAIDNPNAISTCGCGQSFQAKDREGAAEPC